MTFCAPLKSWCLAFLASLVCLALNAQANSGSGPGVGVSSGKIEDALEIKTALLRPCNKGTGYDCIKVDVRMPVDAPQDIVWQVITDYQHAAQFISNLKSSSEISLGPNLVQIEQVGRVGWSAISVAIKTVYKVNLYPAEKKIVSVSVGGDLKTVSMTTQLKPKANGGTLLEYTLTTDPGPWAPLAIAEEILKRQAQQGFADLKKEILKRAAPNNE
jgi:carbon monoxide dehydrogenase subunit G